MIRTLQEHAVHKGIDVFMECTISRLLKDGDRIAARSATGARAGKLVLFKAKAVVLATGGIGQGVRRSRRTRGSTRATATRWPTGPAPT